MSRRVDELSRQFPDWAFSGQDEREDIHDIAQYPAMMVPRMQGLLMDAAAAALGSPPRVYDPFVGSGTTLVEALRRGWAFTGRDINPYAVLLCKAKAASYRGIDFDELVRSVDADIDADRRTRPDIVFSGVEKWFSRDVLLALCRIRASIGRQSNLEARRLLWCVLGETIRTTSNSRTSTFKLHIRPATDTAISGAAVLARFRDSLMDAVRKVSREQERRAGRKSPPEPDLIVTDMMAPATAQSPLANLLVTSPPYGDNCTTVPYGQFSFLPLQFIELADIAPNISTVACDNTHALDTASLGGWKRAALKEEERLTSVSPALGTFMSSLRGMSLADDKKHAAMLRAVAFVRDLELAVTHSCANLGGPAFSMWTIGNRRIVGQEFPLDGILVDLVARSGATLSTTINRRIPSKRMAVKNKSSTTMRTEKVLILVHVPVSSSERV